MTQVLDLSEVSYASMKIVKGDTPTFYLQWTNKAGVNCDVQTGQTCTLNFMYGNKIVISPVPVYVTTSKQMFKITSAMAKKLIEQHYSVVAIFVNTATNDTFTKGVIDTQVFVPVRGVNSVPNDTVTMVDVTAPVGQQKLDAPIITLDTFTSSSIAGHSNTPLGTTEWVFQRSVHGLNTWATIPNTGNTFVDSALAINTQYDYRAKVTAPGFLDSDYSAIVSGTTTGYSQIYTLNHDNNGDLTIDGNANTYLDNSLIIITPGNYRTINIQNLNPATLITIKNGNGVIDINGATGGFGSGLNYQNCSNLSISFNGSADPYGLYIHDHGYRPTNISGVNKNVSLQYVYYKNISDYVIRFNNQNTIWNGTDATVRNINNRFLHNKFELCANSIQLGGNVPFDGSAVQDLNKGVEFGFNTWVNCNSGDLVFGGAIDSFSVHDNTLTNINPTNNDDNGLFHIIGTGDCYNNYVNGAQGHLIRFWTLSFGSVPKTCHAYNNLYISSRKYSPFEWQSSEGPNISGVAPNTTFANVIINNNIGGNLNYEHHTEFDGCLVDNYPMPVGATVEAWNNFIYNTFTGSGQLPLHRIYQFSNGTQEAILLAQKNLYYTDNVAAGFNETTLLLSDNSPSKNAGLPGHLLSNTDFHGVAWNVNTPSIGAVA